MKSSKRNEARKIAQAEKRAAGKPAFSKYERKTRAVEVAGKPQ